MTGGTGKLEHEQRNDDGKHAIGERVEVIERVEARCGLSVFISAGNLFLFDSHTTCPYAGDYILTSPSLHEPEPKLPLTTETQSHQVHKDP